ncbi:MAG: hypothetical protein LBL79_14745 [Prevotella sp.]|nr:hypothetical protein [Prevotella sp.]
MNQVERKYRRIKDNKRRPAFELFLQRMRGMFDLSCLYQLRMVYSDSVWGRSRYCGGRRRSYICRRNYLHRSIYRRSYRRARSIRAE